MRKTFLVLIAIALGISCGHSAGIDGKIISFGSAAISDGGKYTYITQRIVADILVFDNDKGDVVGKILAPSDMKNPNNSVFAYFAKDTDNKVLSNKLIVFIHYPDGYDSVNSVYLPPYSDIWLVSITDMTTNPIKAKWTKINSSSITNNKMIGNLITDPMTSGGIIEKGRIFLPLGNYSTDTHKTMIIYDYSSLLK